MVRAGLSSYGGGAAVIPLLRAEAVQRFHWMSDEEYGQVVAISNALPGPIGTKLSAYLGYQQKGFLGAVVGVVAHIAPTTLGAMVLMGALNFLQQSPAVRGMVAAVEPVIVALLAIMAYEFVEKAWRGLGFWAAAGFVALALLFLQVLHTPAPFVVIGFLAYGAAHYFALDGIRKRLDKGKGAGGT